MVIGRRFRQVGDQAGPLELAAVAGEQDSFDIRDKQRGRPRTVEIIQVLADQILSGLRKHLVLDHAVEMTDGSHRQLREDVQRNRQVDLRVGERRERPWRQLRGSRRYRR